MSSEKDLSGLDVFNMLPRYETQESPQIKPSVLRERTYNLSDVAIRWGCTTGRVKKEISRGLPLAKKPNGRWEITERDLFVWEQDREQQRQAEKKRDRIITTIIVAVILIIFVALVVFGFPLLIDYLR